MNNIYEFEKEDAYRFAREYGTRTKIHKDELMFFTCPYCKGGAHRDKYTFSINLNTGVFNCLRSSCAVKGNMLTLARDFNFEISEDVNRYFNQNNYNSKFRQFKEGHIEIKDKAIKYLKGRGISEKITKQYEITTKNDDDNVLVFPFKDPAGNLKFIKYRNMTYEKGVSAGAKEWCEADCMPILFGMNHCEDFTSLVITEGQIDSLTLAECGIKNAVSVPTGMNGFTWIPHVWDWLCQFEEIVIFGDCENGYVTLADTLANRFPKKSRIVRIEDYQGYKDANDLYRAKGKDAILNAINNAKPRLSTRVKDMADVKYVDIKTIPAISTGMKELDDILDGGFHFGQVILQSGKRGNGKSTVATYFAAEALRQNHSVFIYSGELQDYFVKSWIDGQLAGKTSLYNSEIDKINEWYRGRLKIYDNTIIDDDEIDDLLEIIEDTVKKTDIRMIIIDNLMTALDGCQTNDELYRAQSNFVGKLAKMAKAFELVIILVAHPRKSNAEFDNDSVSGSADITNKVDIVMSYDRFKDMADDERMMVVSKNRLTGKLALGNNGILMFYSNKSRRISTRRGLFDKVFIPDLDIRTIVSNDDLPDTIPF